MYRYLSSLVEIEKTNHFHYTELVTDLHKKYHREVRPGQLLLKGDFWRRGITEIHFVRHNCNEVVCPIYDEVRDCGHRV